MNHQLDSVQRIKRCSGLGAALSLAGLVSSLSHKIFCGPERPNTPGYNHYRLLVNYHNGLQSQRWSLGTNDVRDELKKYQEPLVTWFDETMGELKEDIAVASREASVIEYNNARREHNNNPLHSALIYSFLGTSIIGLAGYNIAKSKESSIYDEGAIRFRRLVGEERI